MKDLKVIEYCEDCNGCGGCVETEELVETRCPYCKTWYEYYASEGDTCPACRFHK